MGRSSTVYVQLINPYRSYFAGQEVEGKVVIQNTKPLKVKRVTILLEGKARVHWTEQEPYTVYTTQTVNGRTQSVARTHYRTVYYTAEEFYVSQKIHLDGDGSNLMVLKEGTVTYPFRFILPPNLPSSFTSRIGLVSYLVEAELKRPLLKPNMRTSLPFTVNGIFDLNLEPGAGQSQEIQRVKGSNFFVCRKGQLGFVLRLPRRSGFVPGEILDFEVEISNGSNKKVTGIKATFKQVSTFYARGKQKQIHRIVNDVKGEEIDRGEHEMWSPRTLVVPSLPPTRLGGGCRIIDVQYFLHFEMKISGLSSSITGAIPIMIGTIPFRSNFVDFSSGPRVSASVPAIPIVEGPEMGFHLPSETKMGNGSGGGPSTSYTVPDTALAPSAPFLANYPDLPPPSYAEAVGAEGFDFTQASTNNDQGKGDDNQPGSSTSWKETEYINASSPSAPSIDSFVPNYITYNKL